MAKIDLDKMQLMYSPFTDTIYLVRKTVNNRILEKRPLTETEEKLIIDYSNKHQQL